MFSPHRRAARTAPYPGRAASVALVALFVAFGLLPLLASRVIVVGDITYDVMVTCCRVVVVGVCLGALVVNRLRLMAPAMLLLGGQTAFVAGRVVLTMTGSPDVVAHTAFAVGYVCTLLGVLILAAGFTGSRGWAVFDGALVGMAGLAALSDVLLVPALDRLRTTQDDLWVGWDNLGAWLYLLPDALVLGLTIRLALRAVRHNGVISMLLCAAVAQTLGDTLWQIPALPFATVRITTDVLYALTAAMYCLAVYRLCSGAAPQLRAVATRSRTSESWLVVSALAIPLGATAITLVVSGDSTSASVILLPLSLLCVAATWRLSVLIRHTDREREYWVVQATQDPLTGVLSRRGWERYREAIEDDESVSWWTVAVVDLDHFKAFNDAHGHHAGDEALRDTARVWRHELPTGAVIARLGGDEFAVALPDVAPAEAAKVLSEVVAHAELPLPASVGIASTDLGRDPNRHDAMRDVLLAADNACYAAKRSGRGCVRIDAGISGAGNQLHVDITGFASDGMAPADDATRIVPERESPATHSWRAVVPRQRQTPTQAPSAQAPRDGRRD